MSEFSSFLSVPIKLRISGEGELLFADPPVWRLHALAGGDDNGAIAIPGLAMLAAGCGQKGPLTLPPPAVASAASAPAR